MFLRQNLVGFNGSIRATNQPGMKSRVKVIVESKPRDNLNAPASFSKLKADVCAVQCEWHKLSRFKQSTTKFQACEGPGATPFHLSWNMEMSTV